MKQQKERIITLEQWVQVAVRNGKTVTKLFPSNEELLRKYREMDPKPDLIYRRINLQGKVPPEYYWTTVDPLQRKYGGHCIQRLHPSVWLTAIAKEGATSGKHLSCLPIMPRPKERGGCDCPACADATARLEREAQANQ